MCNSEPLVSAADEERLLSAVRAACLRLGLRGGRLLLAVSGGSDSLAMLLAIRELSRDLALDVTVATFDHGLREGSAEDAVWVASLCERLGVACQVEKLLLDPRGNREAAARRARYAALRRLAPEGAFIATAHTRDDQVETVLLRLARGTGTRGLRGVLEKRGRIVRPMLDVGRSEIRAFIRARGIEPREDPTNASLALARNRVRHVVLPLLVDALGDRSLDAIARSARVAAEDERFLERLAAAASRRVISECGRTRAEGDANRLAALAPAIRRRVVRRTARRLGIPLAAGHVAAIDRAVFAARPARLALPGGARFEVRYGRFALEREPRDAEPPEPFDHLLPGPGVFLLPQGTVAIAASAAGGAAGQEDDRAIRLDPTRVALPMRLRSRRPGDRFRPRGGHTRKLKAFLIDRKVPREQRDAIPLLVDAAGRVLWVVGLCPSDAAAEGARVDAPWQVRVELASSAIRGGRLEMAQSSDEAATKAPGRGRNRAGIGVHRKGK